MLLVLLSLAACKTIPLAAMPTIAMKPAVATQSGPGEWKVIDYAQAPTVDDIIDDLANKRVVFVGESHERYQHHLSQLTIIQRLHARGIPLAIGLEMIQQPFQQALDDYVAGRIDDTEMLRRTEYFDRWKFDFRLYQPIFSFARKHNIPLRALNVPAEVTRAVSEKGIAGLPPEIRRQVPQTIDRGLKGYRERLAAVFGHHPGAEKHDIEHFIEVQLVWDEGMAKAAADYLREHPERSMVVLAGAGHVVEGTGIPQRLQRRLAVPMATVLQLDSGLDLSAEPADYVILAQARELPPAGLIGVVLKQADRGMEIASIAEGSHAAKAGIQVGDRLIEINGAPISNLADVRLQLWKRKPGDRVRVMLLRGRGAFVRTLEVDVVLK